MTERRLHVFLDADRIAEIHDIDGVWRLAYDPEWLERDGAIALSPHLPRATEPITDQATQRPVQWFFDNLLPEETLRARLAREVRVAEADAFGLLEAYGAESAGALTLLREGQEVAQGGLVALDDAALVQRIRDLPRETLASRAPRKMSLAGAQNKLPVVIREGRVFEPVGASASTHVLKPDHPDPHAYPQSAVNEWFTMCLAGRLGLEIPQVMHRYVASGDSAGGYEAIYVVERFDRAIDGDAVRRVHAIDACQALNLDRTFKYRAMTIESLRELANLTRSRAATRLRLFRWAVFNILVANADAHLKNLSFLATPGGLELAPFYDLVSTGSFDVPGNPAGWRDVPMSLKLPTAERFAAVTVAALVELGEALALRPQVARRTLEAMRSRIEGAADALIRDYESRPFPEGAAILRAGELRVLRLVRHGVISEMARMLVPG